MNGITSVRNKYTLLWWVGESLRLHRGQEKTVEPLEKKAAAQVCYLGKGGCKFMQALIWYNIQQRARIYLLTKNYPLLSNQC